MNHFQEVQALVARGAHLIVNHSGGKDSQATMIVLHQLFPGTPTHVIHAELPGVDWEGLREHIEANSYGLPVIYVRAKKTFFDMVEHNYQRHLESGKNQSPWPDAQRRQCTSDLKRGPIESAIIRISRETGCKLFINVQGIRAAESEDRRAKNPFCRASKALNRAGREVWDWFPIFELETQDVWDTISRAGQTRHPAYDAGMSRLSCCFCILGKKSDLTTAAKLKPELYRQYVQLERRYGKTLSMSRRSLVEITGVQA